MFALYEYRIHVFDLLRRSMSLSPTVPRCSVKSQPCAHRCGIFRVACLCIAIKGLPCARPSLPHVCFLLN
jgi:hypothetical protein